MALRNGHGTGAGVPRVEVLPADELPSGVQAPPLESARGERRPDGRFARGARTVQAAGGAATRGKTRLAAKLGLATLPEGSDFSPYRRAASVFRRVQCAELARTVGGGVCGPGPSSIVASAALALAWSRYFSDLAATTGDAELAMRSMPTTPSAPRRSNFNAGSRRAANDVSRSDRVGAEHPDVAPELARLARGDEGRLGHAARR